MPPTNAMYESTVTVLPPLAFITPHKLVPVKEAIEEYSESDMATLQKLTTALTREAMFGKEEICRSSLRRQNNNGGVNRKTSHYIKTVIKSCVPNMPEVHFEAF